MQIAGEWIAWRDGVTRPMIRAYVNGADNLLHPDYFLIDTGADRTVLSAAFHQQLGLVASPAPHGFILAGIGGSTSFVQVSATMELEAVGGQTVVIMSSFGAFTDPRDSDWSILGRDVLDHFDVIVSSRRKEVWLLTPNHTYQVVTP